MPRGRPATLQNTPKENKKSSMYQERLQLADRIEKTAKLLCEMIKCLKKHGVRNELIARSEQGLEFGILAALWSLDYTDENGNPVQF